MILKAYELMLRAYGPQHWWPGDSPWEICVGAVLTQNTNWLNVEKAIGRLKSAGALSPEAVMSLSRDDLEEAIMPSGFFRLKAERLLAVTCWWLANTVDDSPNWRGRDLEAFRDDLLAVKGVGPETADSILLYCFDLPCFVIDAYTRRIGARHLGLDGTLEYHRLRRIFTEALPSDPGIYNEYHALLVRTAKEACRKGQCMDCCPLRALS